MSSSEQKALHQCHNCGSAQLKVAGGFPEVVRVTSDCKPWPPGGILALCQACGLVQTLVTESWQKECERIYSGYTIYHQSGGVEQPVFDSGSGSGRARSEKIVESFRAHVQLSSKGRWLDIGCGNGALLRACSRALPDWQLFGSEFDDKYRETVEQIPGVVQLLTGPLQNIPGAFDVISLVHVLEHISGPSAFLRAITSKLNPGGWLFVEVPDCLRNAFMLVVADHCSHFSLPMLRRVVGQAGFEVVEASDAWVPKEISVVARISGAPTSLQLAVCPDSEEVLRGWDALQKIASAAQAFSETRPFGLFGTSIAATWLAQQIAPELDFFVDEDPTRVGKNHLDKPIVAPQQIPPRAAVYVALPKPISELVIARLRVLRPDVHFLAP